MKRTTWLAALLTLVMTLCLASGAFAASAVEIVWQTVTLPEVNLTLSIPQDYTVYTRGMDPSDSRLILISVSRDELDAMLENWNYYLDALDLMTMDEIYVTMTHLEMPDFDTLTDEMLRKYCEVLKPQMESVTGATILDYDTCRAGGVAYLVFHEHVTDELGNAFYGLQYYTAVNNKAINIVIKKNNGEDIGEKETDIIRRIVESAVYGDLEK